MLKLGDNWKQVLTKAWSVRFMIVAALLTGLEAVLPLLNVPSWLVFSVVSAGLFSRFMVQKDIK